MPRSERFHFLVACFTVIDGNKWRRERKEFMHPRYARVKIFALVRKKVWKKGLTFSYDRSCVEVGSSNLFSTIFAMFKLFLRQNKVSVSPGEFFEK